MLASNSSPNTKISTYVEGSLHIALCTPLREHPRKALSEADDSLRSSQFCHPDIDGESAWALRCRECYRTLEELCDFYFCTLGTLTKRCRCAFD